VSLTEQQQLQLDFLQQQQRSLVTLRALISAQLNIDGRRASLRYALVYQHPGNVRLEILPPGAAYALMVITARDGAGEILDVEQKHFYQGAITPAVMRKFIGFPVEVTDLSAFLIGTIPPSVKGNVRVESQTEEGTHFAALDGSWRGLYVPDRMHLATQELSSVFDDSMLMSVAYQSYGQCTDVMIPYHTRVELGSDVRTAALRVRSAKCNGDVPARLFTLSAPAGYQLRTLQNIHRD
jgi:hypothetical protein